MTESKIQTAIMNLLITHPNVAWAMVTTTGKVKLKGYWTSLGFPGLSDIIGQLRDGRVLALEVKRPGELPTAIQLEFLALVESNGGVSGWCDSVEGVMEILEV